MYLKEFTFDANGTGHYYFKEGASAFTPSDEIYDTKMFLGGSNAKMDYIAYNFISIGYPAGDPDISADYQIDDISIYIANPVTRIDVTEIDMNLESDFNNDCKVYFNDLAEFVSLWLHCYNPEKVICN